MMSGGWLRNIPTDIGLTKHTRKLWAETDHLRIPDLDRELFLGYSLNGKSETKQGGE
jgi:hypothetical protein